MENKIPVPTDNIFKFYALFGLLLFVFSCGSLLYVNATTNALIFSGFPEVERLKQIASPSRGEQAQITMLEKKIEIAVSDKKFFQHATGVFAGIAVVMMSVGFWKWHTKVQPILDKTAKVQLKISKLQLLKLRRELGIKTEAGPAEVVPTAEAIVVRSEADNAPII